MLHIHITRKRMKNMRITVETDGTVKVSAPKRVSDKQIQDFIESRKPWIEKAHQHYAKTKELFTVPAGELLLHGRGYKLLPSSKPTILINYDDHTISTKKDLTQSARQLAFYKSYAKKYLSGKLELLAHHHGLKYNKCIIRGQKTKWGTCSVHKNIGLNRKLVKMPHEIAEYVICHELAHLTHLNHSQNFWNEVERLYPDYKTAETWMRKHGIGLQ